MAEKYGVVPKRFTKEWWDYFWMYYKWHTIVIAFIVIAVGTTIHQKVTAPEYDLTLTYAGIDFYPDEVRVPLEELLSENVSDVNGNGKKLASFSQLNFPTSQAEAEYMMAMNVKLQMALSEDETYLFIMDKDLVERYSGEDEDSCVFAPLEAWLTAEVSEDKKFGVHQKKTSVLLDGNKFFEKAGVDVSGKYLCMRFYPRKDQKEQLAGYEAAVELANKILNN